MAGSRWSTQREYFDHLLGDVGHERTSGFDTWNGSVVLLGELAVGAGLCTIAAGVWKASSGKCWLLALHGIALGALGVIQYGFTDFRIGLLTVALLMAVMAVSLGVLGLMLAKEMGPSSQAAERWVLVFRPAWLPAVLLWCFSPWGFAGSKWLPARTWTFSGLARILDLVSLSARAGPLAAQGCRPAGQGRTTEPSNARSVW